MSHRGRGVDKSSLGKAKEVGQTPIREASSARPSTAESSTELSARTDSAELAKTTKAPTTPTTPTLEAATTGTDSENSSEHGQDEGEASQQQPRQVIAVSVSKGPSAFFNLARKFLVTDEVCDLSALEGAIVSAVDAAHLLERSKIATITRIQTSYVAVEPKKRKDHGHEIAAGIEEDTEIPSPAGASSLSSPSQNPLGAVDTGRVKVDPSTAATELSSTTSPGKSRTSAGTLRRARIIITVRRTEAYKKWLEENPLQDVISGEDVERM